MQMMESTSVLIPMLTLMGFTLVVTLSIGVARNIAVMTGRVRIKVFATFSEPGETEGLLAMRRNLANLYELPTIFYALCLTAFAAGVADSVTLGLAWAFVATRIVHTAIHITYNNVLHRFLVFATGVTIVAVMIIRIAAHLPPG
jgi:hypothetical protein